MGCEMNNVEIGLLVGVLQSIAGVALLVIFLQILTLFPIEILFMGFGIQIWLVGYGIILIFNAVKRKRARKKMGWYEKKNV